MKLSKISTEIPDEIVHPIYTEGDSQHQFIELDITNILKSKFDAKAFSDGLKSISKIAGMITGLTNVGVAPEVALDYIAGKETREDTKILQEKLAIEDNETQIKIAKITGEASVIRNG